MTFASQITAIWCKTCDKFIELGSEQNALLHTDHELRQIESFDIFDTKFEILYCFQCKTNITKNFIELSEHEKHIKYVGKDNRPQEEKQQQIIEKVKQSTDFNADGVPLPNFPNDMKDVHGIVADKIMTLDYYATIPAAGTVYKYDNGVYVDYEKGINELVNKMIIFSKESNRKEIFNYIKAHTEHSYDDFDRDPNIHNLKNGLLNIETMELRSHTPDYLSLRQFKVDYIPDAVCPEFDQTLIDNLPDPIERQMFLECLAMCLIPEFNFKKAGVFYGPSNAGKSSIVSLLDEILGEPHISSYSVQDFDNDRFSCGGLIGKYANITHDMGHQRITRIHKFKNIADHKPVESERKYGHSQNIAHKVACIFLANHLPDIAPEVGEGFFSRIVLIEFKQTYAFDPTPEELERGVKKIDNQRIEKLHTELSGIYLKLLNIAKKMKEQKRFTFVITPELIEQQWYKLENPINWFNEEYLVKTFDSKDFVFLDDLYKEYAIQSKKIKENVISQRKFNHYITQLYIKSDREDPRAENPKAEHRICITGVQVQGYARHDNLRSSDSQLNNLLASIREDFNFGDEGMLVCKKCQQTANLETFVIHKCNSQLL